MDSTYELSVQTPIAAGGEPVHKHEGGVRWTTDGIQLHNMLYAT